MTYTLDFKSGKYLDLAISMSVIDTDEENSSSYTLAFYIEYINGTTSDFTDRELIKITHKYFELKPDALKSFNKNISLNKFSVPARVNLDAHTTIIRSFYDK